MRRIMLPQAARIAVPPLSNTLLSLVKDTSLASVVLVPELFREAQDAASLSGEFLALYALAALYYWVVCFVDLPGPGPARTTTREVRDMTATTTEPLIEVRGLHKSFGDHEVLRGVDFDAAEGTATALLGPSGSGKTTVLRSLNVLETPDAGTVRIADAAVDFGAAARQGDTATRGRGAARPQRHGLPVPQPVPAQDRPRQPHRGARAGAGATVDEAAADARRCSSRSASTAARTPTRPSSPADSSSGSASPARWR